MVQRGGHSISLEASHEGDTTASIEFAPRQYLANGNRNAGFITYNANGKSENEMLRDEVVKMVRGPFKPNGIMLLDPRPPPSRTDAIKRFWEDSLQGTGVIVRVLAGRPPANCPAHTAEASYNLVGGSIMLFFPSPGVKFKSIHYDPGKFGIVNRVTIGIGPTKRLQWLGVYVPPTGDGSGPGSLTCKLEEW
jgi:hypothetical protein